MLKMHFRIRTARHVWLSTLLTTSISVAVPLAVVVLALGPSVLYRMPAILAITGLIPLFIAFPISLFAFNIVKAVNQTMEALDGLIKYDGLTGLIGRTHFLRMIKEQRKNAGFLALLDADHFKRINDTYGHEAGDHALKHMADTFIQVFGKHGFVGRMGGEEFAAYLPGLSKEQAHLLTAEVGMLLRNCGFAYNGVQIAPTVSIGLVSDRNNEPATSLFRRADRCLYMAKAKGRDRTVFETELDVVARSAA
jgi:diguanylate cyclase